MALLLSILSSVRTSSGCFKEKTIDGTSLYDCLDSWSGDPFALIYFHFGTIAKDSGGAHYSKRNSYKRCRSCHALQAHKTSYTGRGEFPDTRITFAFSFEKELFLYFCSKGFPAQPTGRATTWKHGLGTIFYTFNEIIHLCEETHPLIG